MEYITPAPLGAELLDEKVPGWADRIDLEEFHISSTWHCVLAQLFDGDYIEGLRVLFPGNNRSSGDRGHPAYVHGFDRYLGTTEFSWENLQEEWEALISERKTA